MVCSFTIRKEIHLFLHIHKHYMIHYCIHNTVLGIRKKNRGRVRYSICFTWCLIFYFTGWSLHSVQAMDLHITKINDLRGSCNKTKIEAAKNLATRKTGLINIFNDDNKCLLYCIAASVTKKTGWTQLQKSNPASYKEIVDLILTDGISFLFQ